jgi:hypothetical protein
MAFLTMDQCPVGHYLAEYVLESIPGMALAMKTRRCLCSIGRLSPECRQSGLFTGICCPTGVVEKVRDGPTGVVEKVRGGRPMTPRPEPNGVLAV